MDICADQIVTKLGNYPVKNQKKSERTMMTFLGGLMMHSKPKIISVLLVDDICGGRRDVNTMVRQMDHSINRASVLKCKEGIPKMVISNKPERRKSGNCMGLYEPRKKLLRHI